MKRDTDPGQPERTEAPAAAEPKPQADRLRRVFLSAGLICAFICGGAVVRHYLITTRPAVARSEIGSLPPLVQVQRLVLENIEEEFLGYGSARAECEASIAAEVNGLIAEIPDGIKDGAHVSHGQVLVRIDSRQYDQQLRRAQALLADVEAQLTRLDVEKENVQRLIDIAAQEVKVNHDEYKRLTDLYEREVASKKEWDFARLAYQRASRESQSLENERALIEPRKAIQAAARIARTAEVELARLDVQRCTVKAPFAGQLQELLVKMGDRVGIGGPIARMIDPRRIEVPIELPLGVHPRLSVGAACSLTVDSMPGVRWQLPVSRIAPIADARSRTFTVFVEVDNANQAVPMVPGFFLTARIAGPMICDTFVIPRGAIVQDHVFVLEGDIARLRSVEARALVGDRAVIAGQLSPGDKVVLTNMDRLFDGAKVRLNTTDATTETAPEVGRAPGQEAQGETEAGS